MRLKWFTLVEMLIVISIVAAILWATMNLWWQYFQELQYRQDKESFIGLVDEFLSMARTSSYYANQRFEVLDISLDTWSIIGYVWESTLDAFGTGRMIDTYALQEASLEFPDLPLQVRLYPYTIWCDIIQWGTGFTMVADSTDDITCFEIFSDVCKIKQTTCP
jgi:Tfp pilus assembly protein PilE